MSVTNNFKLGQTVYHETVYESREPLTVVGIRENELELEGDYSGGTHQLKQKEWLPIKGCTTIHDFKYKKECRESVIEMGDEGLTLKERELRNMILHLTTEVHKYLRTKTL